MQRIIIHGCNEFVRSNKRYCGCRRGGFEKKVRPTRKVYFANVVIEGALEGSKYQSGDMAFSGVL